MSEWLDIETAPKDQTTILLVKAYRVSIDDAPKIMWASDGWWEDRLKRWTDGDVIFDDPTHWMPMPEPPK